jgi:UDP-N-acetyl-D-galactosamine dehydrogenase
MSDTPLAVIGLGYVGLPVAVAFGKRRPVIGFDVSPRRVAELRAGVDTTGEVAPDALAAARLTITADPEDLRAARTFIVAVPTPIDAAKRPDLSSLTRACETVGAALSPGALVVFESTVYPGCTRRHCVPILERVSGLAEGRDFVVGYSPERINPGDTRHTVETIVKVTAGSTPEAADRVDALYREIVTAGTFRASSIEVAEAAKVIENTQRDINIALMNELSLLFHRLGLDTLEVLEAAGTKWNFLPFRPGLVGGHCIGVDPYYLTHRAAEVGYHPEVILAGRRINDAMGRVVAERTALLMMKRGFPVVGSRVLVLGLTFKEDVPDLRNSRAVDVVAALQEFQAAVDVHDPIARPEDALAEHGITLVEPATGAYDAIIVAVRHGAFVDLGARVREWGRPGAVVFDVKGALPKDAVDGRL